MYKLIIFLFFYITIQLFLSSISFSTPQVGNQPTPTNNMQNNPIRPTNEPNIFFITLSAIGDCTLGSDDNFGYEDTFTYVFDANKGNYKYFFQNVAPILKADDYTIANLETPLTLAKNKASKTFAFHGHPDYTKILKEGSIEAVNLANNHSYDYLEEGYLDTISFLKKDNIDFFDENNIQTIFIKGFPFTFIGYNGFYATDELLTKLKNEITTVKKQGHFTFVSFHWGIEGDYYPDYDQQVLAHYAIDVGADAVIGHHPHVIQGIETYKKRFILYSLGNFCFGGNANPYDKDTYIGQFIIEIANNKPINFGFKAIPCSLSSVDYINDYKPTLLIDKNKTRLLDKLNSLSPQAGFEISDNFYMINLNK